MRRSHFPEVLGAFVLLLLTPAIVVGGPNEAELAPYALTGKVTTSATPLAQARVYAYQVSDLTLRRVDTDGIGSFLFSELPAGLYKIIAFKSGFVPAVVLLQRHSAEAVQYLEVDLAPQDQVSAEGGSDFWSLRKGPLLSLIVLGGSFVKPVITGTAARHSNLDNRARAFSLFYMVVNIG